MPYTFELEGIDFGNIMCALRNDGQQFLASKLQEQYDAQHKKVLLEEVLASVQSNYEKLADMADQMLIRMNSEDELARNYIFSARHDLYKAVHYVDKAVKIYAGEKEE